MYTQCTDIVEIWRFRNIQKHETPNKIDTKELQIDLIKHLLYYFPSVKALLSHQDLLTLNYDVSQVSDLRKWVSERALGSVTTCYYERHNIMTHLMMTHTYCTTAVSIDTHTGGGKHSAEQTQTVDTLLYPDELVGFFYTWLSRLRTQH